MKNKIWVVGLVGVCGSGKTTLSNALRPYPFHVRQIAQEHSYVPDMWQRLAKPDVLIFLNASYLTTLKRKPFNWNETEYNEQLRRLEHANHHANLHVTTDDLTPAEVLKTVLTFLQGFVGGNITDSNEN